MSEREDEEQRLRIADLKERIWAVIEGSHARDSVNAMLDLVCFNWVAFRGSLDDLQKVVGLLYPVDARKLGPSGPR